MALVGLLLMAFVVGVVVGAAIGVELARYAVALVSSRFDRGRRLIRMVSDYAKEQG